MINSIRKARQSVARLLLKVSNQLAPELGLHIEQFPFQIGTQGEPFKFLEDGLATIHACDFLSDRRFIRAYRLGNDTGSWKNWAMRWRVRVILWCATWAKTLPGAFVECGVNRGGFTQAILDYTDFAKCGKEYFLFDTFAGFDPAQLSSDEARQLADYYHYDDCYKAVTATFGQHPFIRIIRGSVPDTLQSSNIDSVAFLSIDLNCVEPEIAAIEFFWCKLVPGAIVILDDYGFTRHHAQKKAFQGWSRRTGIEILDLPTGQGLIFKPLV